MILHSIVFPTARFARAVNSCRAGSRRLGHGIYPEIGSLVVFGWSFIWRSQCHDLRQYFGGAREF
ncbi:hypothetical protein X798_08015 [Onchocerca flexuosa]|uniref:Uncharacterized protein n=1 Tax=Onchocerca flexuosa TaxID=387005 RepID=A0A238BIE4_9BILA|nr:hypothetical protein X798_08015 [Onchocerca flexuosa]